MFLRLRGETLCLSRAAGQARGAWRERSEIELGAEFRGPNERAGRRELAERGADGRRVCLRQRLVLFFSQ